MRENNRVSFLPLADAALAATFLRSLDETSILVETYCERSHPFPLQKTVRRTLRKFPQGAGTLQ